MRTGCPNINKGKFLVIILWLLTSVSSFAQTPSRRPITASPSAAFTQLIQRAEAARQADKLDDAIRLYQQALRQKANWVEGWWALGTMYYQLDRYSEGRAAFQKLLALAPQGGVGWAFLGLCEYQLKDYQNALAHLSKARSLGIGGNAEITAVANYHAAILLNRFAQFELAYAVLLETAKLQNESPALIEAFGLTMLRLPYLPSAAPAEKREMIIKTGRAAYLGATDQRPAAQQEFNELLTMFPQASDVHYAYGVFLLRDSPDEALREFSKEIEISPKHVFARLQIAFEALKRNDHKMGLPYAEEAVRLAPELFAAHNALGRILLELGQTERAIKELEIGVKQASDSPEMYFALARAYSKAGRKLEADKARAEFMRLDKIRRARKESFVGEKPAPEAKPE